MPRYLAIFVLLGLVWLGLSGEFSLHHPLVAIMGVLSCLLVCWLLYRMDTIDHHTLRLPIYWGRWLAYFAWLQKEIVTTNLQTALQICRYVLGDKTAIAPQVKTLPCPQKTNEGKVIYANSITLTPGTVTLALKNNTVTVHALHKSSVADLETGDMAERVNHLEKEQ